ncbi:MAG: competence/damage-inducible protein A [Chloroflexi bacterium]|nr:competence/damage-inducible protein A [Chloroflexota bacterium]
MKAEIIAVGTELLSGQSQDTNSTYLAGRLVGLGIELVWVTLVGDDVARLSEAVQRALVRSDLVITSGGLGPTPDDVTRDAIAVALDEELFIDPALEAWLREFFQRRGRDMPLSNLRQARRIVSAQALPNPRGTAPGWWIEKQGKLLVALPGPPLELEGVWREEIEPKLQGRSGQAILSRTLKVNGLPEATVAEWLGELATSANPALGIYAKRDGIQIRFTASAASEAEARRLMVAMEERLRAIFGEAIWGADDDTPETVAGRLLQERGLSLAVMESFSGGLLASTITDVPGSSAYFKGGLVAYSAAVKVGLGVPRSLIDEHGTVSAEVAAAMARAARQALGADFGLSTTGVAGPDAIEEKPVGTVFIAVDGGGQSQVVQGYYPPRRLDVKRLAVLDALHLLRRQLLALKTD